MTICRCLLICLLVSSVHADDVNVRDCGAVGDGQTLCTESIQQAIDRCADTSGGTVTVPFGTFLTNTIFLKSNVNLHLAKGAVLLGSTDSRAFRRAVVYADGIENAAITGLGTIDGQGFKTHYPTSGPRHNNICLFKSRNIRVQDVTLTNAPSWVFRIQQCDGVMVRGVRIYSFANENNDGIDIDGKNVTISDCLIDCDDDAMCLKSDEPEFLVENVAISNCVIASNCNAIKFGTASHCGFRNVSISNCTIRRPSESVHRPWSQKIQGVTRDDTVISGVALEVVDGGFMDQVTISNLSMTGIQTPLFIRLGSRKGRGTLQNVVISGIAATNESLITSSITGIPGSYVENVTIRDILFRYKGTGTLAEANAPVPEKETAYPENRMFGYSLPAYGLYVRHVKNLVCEDFRFTLQAPDARPAVLLEDCHNLRLSGFDVAPPAEGQPLVRCIESTNVTLSGYQSATPAAKFLVVEGESSAHIKLAGNDFRGIQTVVELEDGAEPSAVQEMQNFQ
jgi:polygalacturonase